MKVLVITFDQRPRYKTLVQYLEENGILYDFLKLSNSSLVSDIREIKQAHKTKQPSHTILIGFDRTAITWIFICSIFRQKLPIIRLGGDPIKVPLSRAQYNKENFLVSFKQQLRLLILKIALKAPKKFITVSTSLANSNSLTGKDCFVLPIYPELINEKPKQYQPSDRVKLLTVTNLNYYEKYQGVLHIIRSAAIACKHHSITLSIVGNGDYLPKLIKEVEKYTQDNLEIIATGYTDNVSNYYNSADIFAYHSTLDSWPNVLMEAMAHGMPIIANNHQQFSEVFCKKQQAILCESGNESCLTKTLLNLIENQKTYNHSAQLSTSRAIELSSNKRNISIFKNWLREIYIKE